MSRRAKAIRRHLVLIAGMAGFHRKALTMCLVIESEAMHIAFARSLSRVAWGGDMPEVATRLVRVPRSLRKYVGPDAGRAIRVLA